MNFPSTKELLQWDKQRLCYYLARLYIMQCVPVQKVKAKPFKSTLFPIMNFFKYHCNTGELFKMYDWLKDAVDRGCQPCDVPLAKASHFARLYEERKRYNQANATARMTGHTQNTEQSMLRDEYSAYNAYLQKIMEG